MSEENIYCLNGRVPVKKAIPFGLQHVLAMFVSICTGADRVQCGICERIAESLKCCGNYAASAVRDVCSGIGTCLQLYPVWKIGSRLPIVMGVSLPFCSLLMICTNSELGYEGWFGAVIAGGIFEDCRNECQILETFLTPVVSACVVIAIGLSSCR